MYFNVSVCYLYFETLPHPLYGFLRCVIKWMHQCIYVYQHTAERGNKVRGVPYKFTGHTIGGVSRALIMHRTIFYFILYFTLKISLNFKY